MNLADLRIGVRLSVGFAFVMSLMTTMIVAGLVCLSSIGEITAGILRTEWIKADAIQIINARTRSNTALTMRLFITTDKNQISGIYREIDDNKVVIDEALAKLDRLAVTPEEKSRLGNIKESRTAYVASFSKVGKLLAAGRKDEAIAVLNDETRPALVQLQEHVTGMVKLQRRLVGERGEDAKQNIDSARKLLIGLGLASVLVGIGCAYAITRSITRPLREAVQVAQTVASGDLTSRIDVRSNDETGRLLHALGRMNENLKKIVCDVRTGTDTIATASSQIASGNLDLSSRTEEQASSLEQTVAAMQELTNTVKQNTDHALMGNQLAASASEVAIEGGAVISQVIDRMSAIRASADKIVEIISVIENFAFQTNILALNAAVEAARAGQQGKGFGVVATEVRTLAQRSASAAKDIRTVIHDSFQQVQSGSELVTLAGSTMSDVVASVRRVSSIMSEITAASQAQSTGIVQITQAMTQMDQVTQQNAALVEEAAAAADSLQNQAGRLARLVGTFKLDAMHTVNPA
ncbi:methyl-accepting chemotaxis protein [Burkholderia sp. AW49-1]